KHLLETADYGALAERFRQAALAGQFDFVTYLFNKAQEHGMSLATIGEKLIRPATREVGELWRTGKIGVLDEHLAMVATVEASADDNWSRRRGAHRHGSACALSRIALRRLPPRPAQSRQKRKRVTEEFRGGLRPPVLKLQNTGGRRPPLNGADIFLID